jgi:hypothetical protein
LRPISEKLVAILLLALFVCDLISRRINFVGSLGTGFWLLSIVVLLVASVVAYVDIFRFARQHRTWRTWSTTSVWIAFVLVGCVNWDNLHYESTQQVATALHQLVDMAGSGFVGTSHFGYPTRGLFIAALPSLLFGRGPGSLFLGGALSLLIGLTLFARGFLVGKSPVAEDRRAALCVALLPHVPFFVAATYNYEQSNYPVGLALGFCGVTLRYGVERSLSSLLTAILLLYHLAFAYTPGLAVFFLGLVWLVDIARQKAKPKLHRQVALAALLGGTIVLLLSWLIRADVRLNGAIHHNTSVTTLQRSALVLEWIVRPQFSITGMSPVAQILLVVGVPYALAGKLGKRAACLVAWACLAIFFGAARRVGTSDYLPPESFFRIAIVFPVLLVVLEEALRRKKLPARVLLGAWIGCLGFGIFSYAHRIVTRPTERQAPIVRALYRAIPSAEREQRLTIATAPLEESNTFHSLQDFLPYFFPGANVRQGACETGASAYPIYLVLKYGSDCMREHDWEVKIDDSVYRIVHLPADPRLRP